MASSRNKGAATPYKPALIIELITLILSYLPVKSLLRFKSVSKEWNSLISSSYFINLHNHRSNNRFLIGDIMRKKPFCKETRAVDSNLTLTNKFFLPKVFEDKTDKYFFADVVGTCHGLLVLQVKYDEFDRQDDLVMWNPSTNNYMVLPPVHFPDSQERGCDCGFGYDKLTNDYKLVMFAYVFEDDDEGHSKMYSQHVYSAKRNSWGPPLVVNTGYMNHYCDHAAVVDDHILNWLFWNQPNNSKIELRGFDICTEEWLKTGPLPLPALVAGDRCEGPRLESLNNCLYLSNYDHRHGQSHVWVMKEYGVKESWTKLFSLSDGGNGVGIDIISPPIAHYEGQLLIELRGASGKFFWYNLKDRTLKPTGNRNCLTRTLCTESLVPIPILFPTKEQVTGSFDREFNEEDQ